MKSQINKFSQIVFSIMGLMFLALPASAQSESSSFFQGSTMELIISFVLVVLMLVLLVMIYLLQTLRAIVDKETERIASEKGQEVPKKLNLWSNWMKTLTDSVPIEKEAAIDLNHDYDGIRELDNHLPPWWKWLFYLTIIFAVVYIAAYHVFDTLPLQTEEYEMAMKDAEEAKLAMIGDMEEVAIDESSITFSDDPAILASGKTIYERNCVACHKSGGEGGIGPNLTDEFWLHGGSIQDTYNTIKNGVPEKGMIAWKDVLSPAKMNDVNSYIYTLRGTNPPGAKGPQGEKYVAETTSVEDGGGNIEAAE